MFIHKQTSKRTEIGEEGIVKFEKGISKYAANYEKAASLISEGQLKQAEKIYLELMEIDSDNIDLIYVGLGTVYNQRNEYTKEIQHYNKAMSIDSNSYLGYLGLASVYYRQSNFEKALTLYRVAKTSAPERPDAYWGLSITFEALAQPDSSAYYAEKFSEMAPDSKYAPLFKEKDEKKDTED